MGKSTVLPGDRNFLLTDTANTSISKYTYSPFSRLLGFDI